MDRGGASMDAAGQDEWDWEEVLPDHLSSRKCHDNTILADDQQTKEPIIMPLSSSDADVHEKPMEECKDIGVVLEETEQIKEEEAMPEVADDPSASDGEDEEEKAFQSLDTEKADDRKVDDGEEEEDDATKKDNGGGARPECVVFSVGKLKVNGIGALCSFGVAAATVCIFLIGGKLQHHHRQQQHEQKIQLQFYGDDKRIQQVVRQTSRLNQAMSSVMGGGGGSSTRANISFGGFYDGF